MLPALLQRTVRVIPVAIFLVLVVITLLVRLHVWSGEAEPKVSAEFQQGAADQRTLFIYVHGLDGGRHWEPMRDVLLEYGDTLMLSYAHPLFSNMRPEPLADLIANTIAQKVKRSTYDRITLLGQSMGALLIKRAFLDAEAKQQQWTDRVKRIVLVAGMNRGWDISGQKPSDMHVTTAVSLWAGTWFGRLLNIGGLILSTEAGTPFVANLRVDWISRMRDASQHPDAFHQIEVVQLLGDIDDLVSEEDNKDLQALNTGQFAWLRVRGTGHSDITVFNDTRLIGNTRINLGEYRREKFELAAAEPDFSKVMEHNEVQPFQPDEAVTDIVFVVHGIRDLGEWAAEFEQQLHHRFSSVSDKGASGKLAIASVRYGYFGMGPFLFKPIREKYVKWFMDEYTETLALYPNARNIHFVGHSNGTYLLAAALQRYQALRVDRVVFGGSVVRKGYDWSEILPCCPDLKVRNYTAVDDWVVALFPRFFEVPTTDFLFRNDLGSAGYYGFEKNNPRVENIPGLTGGHSAFISQIPEIAAFLFPSASDANAAAASSAIVDTKVKLSSKVLSTLSSWGASWATWFIVWPLLVVVVIGVGWHVVTAAPEPRLPMLALYLLLVLFILRTV